MRQIPLLRVLSASILSLCLIAPAAAQQRLPPKLHGFWDNAEDGCKSFHSEGRLIITRDALEYYETMCRIRSLAPAGKDVWKVRATCANLDGSATSRFELRLSADGKQLIDQEGNQPYRRCEPTPPR